MSNTTEILVSASMFGKLYSKMIMEVADKYSNGEISKRDTITVRTAR